MSRTKPVSVQPRRSFLELDTRTLCGAVATGNVQLVKQLLDSGADVNEVSPDGCFSLCIAALWGHAEIVKLLLEAKADINAANSGTGWTATHCAAFKGHGKVLMYLTQYQPDITLKDAMGRTAVDFASAQDAIWPYFGVLKCRQTPKEDLIRLEIIEKAETNSRSTATVTTPALKLSQFSRPGSSYILSDPTRDPRNSSKETSNNLHGDILYEEMN